MNNESIVTITDGWSFESRAPPETAKGIFVTFFAEDFLLQLVFLLLVICLLLRLEPPELVRERKISEDQGELFYLSLIQKLRVGDGAGSAFDVGFQTMQHGVDLANCVITPIHL